MFGCQTVNVSPSPWQTQRGPGDAQINPRWECWVPAYKQVKIQSCHFELPVSQNALLSIFLDHFRAYESYGDDINIKSEYRARLFYFVPDSSILSSFCFKNIHEISIYIHFSSVVCACHVKRLKKMFVFAWVMVFIHFFCSFWCLLVCAIVIRKLARHCNTLPPTMPLLVNGIHKDIYR